MAKGSLSAPAVSAGDQNGEKAWSPLDDAEAAVFDDLAAAESRLGRFSLLDEAVAEPLSNGMCLSSGASITVTAIKKLKLCTGFLAFCAQIFHRMSSGVSHKIASGS